MMEKNVLHYEILEKLGQGGMGVVYKAFDTRLRRPVALKFFSETLIPDPESKERLLHEAQAASGLEHPNICTIHGIEETPDGRPFICMAWCDGETLQRKIAGAPVGVAEAIDIAIQIAEGLGEAHAAHLVHRDIKPSNIMLSSRGQVRIMDFGLAKLADATRLTKSATTAGTMQYMSPEQVKGQAIGCATDIWSLGVVLYEMVTGRLPFGGDYEATILYGIVNEEYKPASKLSAAVPQQVDDIIARALKKNPQERYASAREMQRALAEAKRVVVGERRVSRAARGGAVPRLLRRKRIWITAGLAALLVVSGLAASRLLRGTARPVTIAVLPSGPAYPDTSATGVLADYLSDNLRRSPNLRVVSADTLIELCRRHAVEDVGGDGGYMLCEFAGAQRVVRFSQARTARGVQLRAQVFDVAGRKQIFEKRTTGAARDTRITMVENLADTLALCLKSLPRRESPRWFWPFHSRQKGVFREGESIYVAGDPQRGIPLIETAAHLDTTLVPAYQRLALWYAYAGDRGNARRCAQKAKQAACARGKALDCMKAQIVEYRAIGQYQRAIDYMNSYLSQAPRDVAMRLSLGYVLYHDQKECAEAIDCLKKVFRLDPKNTSRCWAGTYNCLGSAYLYAGLPDSAMSSYLAFERMNPGVDPITSIANAHRVTGDFTAAIAEYRRAMSVDPDFFVTYEELALTYRAIGKWRSAIGLLDTYVKKAPSNMLGASGHALIGTIWLSQGDEGQAGREVAKALALDSLSLRARWLRGRIALADGARAAASAELGEMSRIIRANGPSPAEAYYHDLKGWVLLADSNRKEGIGELTEAVRVSAQHDEDFFRRELALACLEAGRTDAAAEEALGLLARNGSDAEMLVLLGRAYEKRGQGNVARDYYRQAREIWKEAEAGFRPLADLRSQLDRTQVETHSQGRSRR